MNDADVPTDTWTRFEYDRLVEAEILGPADRIELLGGAMVVKKPPDSPHATAIQLVQRVLTAALGHGWSVRAQLPVVLDRESQPEPDVCVVPGDPRDDRDAHPEHPVLVVEVALSRLRFDREHKGCLYARARIAYWIVNIPTGGWRCIGSRHPTRRPRSAGATVASSRSDPASGSRRSASGSARHRRRLPALARQRGARRELARDQVRVQAAARE